MIQHYGEYNAIEQERSFDDKVTSFVIGLLGVMMFVSAGVVVVLGRR